MPSISQQRLFNASQNMANSARRVLKLHAAYSEANTQQKSGLLYIYRKEAVLMLSRCLKLWFLLLLRGNAHELP